MNDMLTPFHTIFWDFDGVIMDSVPIRDRGYWHVLGKHFPGDQIEKLIEFQQKNGGLSRYVKFRYFYEEILGREITESRVTELADQFSVYMLQYLINPDLLIEDTMRFIRAGHKKFSMHIVSGSDQVELRHICRELEIDRYFKSIHGSPASKNILVDRILEKHQYDRDRTVLIGDSINDADAARRNGICFLGYNNEALRGIGEGYINFFQE